MSSPQPDPAHAAAALLTALTKLPPYTGIVFHGSSEIPQLSRSRTTTGLTATSRDPRVATENFSAPVVVAILSRTGRDISAFSRHPAEQEVVLPPGALLHSLATDTCRDGSTPLVVLEQLAPLDPSADLPPTLADLVDSIRRRIDEAARSAPVEILTPGKFVEPLSFS